MKCFLRVSFLFGLRPGSLLLLLAVLGIAFVQFFFRLLGAIVILILHHPQFANLSLVGHPLQLQFPEGGDGAIVVVVPVGGAATLGVHAVVDPLAERDLGQVAEQDEVAQDDLGAPLSLLLSLLQLQLQQIVGLYILLHAEYVQCLCDNMTIF